jgi:hypothetical protein
MEPAFSGNGVKAGHRPFVKLRTSSRRLFNKSLLDKKPDDEFNNLMF